MSKVFCFGNGISRKHLNLDVFKKYGKTIGCNAIYRDFSPDILVATDVEMAHEIYRSNYCKDNITYLVGWDPLPIDALDIIMQQSEDIGVHTKGKILSSISIDEDDTEFVFHGNTGECMYATGLKANSKMISLEESKDLGFSGTLSISIATDIKNVTDIYLIGHDIYSNTSSRNNIYEGTNCYKHKSDINSERLISGLKKIFNDNLNINFHKVNKNDFESSEWPNHRQKTDAIIEEFSDCANLHYTTQNKLMKILDKD